MLDRIIEEKKKELDMIYYDRYSPLFVDAATFLSNKKALMYGGTALNELLPTTLKFYEPYSLPDIDVLSPYAKKLASRMVSFYKKNKHEAVSFTEALHPGTYKVYANGVQIADITQCSEKTYDTLVRSSVRATDGLKVIPPTYLRMTLHKILSQPNDAHRWKNVFARLDRFYKVFPITCHFKTITMKKNKEEIKTIETDDDIVETIETILPPDVIFFGQEQVKSMLGRTIPFELPPILALTSQDLPDVARMVKKEVPGLQVSKVFPMDDLVLPHILLSVGKKVVGIVFQLASCIAFNDYQGRRVASIHAMLDIFLSMSMSHYPHFKKNKTYLECLADELAWVQQNTAPTRKIRKELVLACHGPSTGVATLRRERAKRMLARKKKNKKNTDLYG